MPIAPHKMQQFIASMDSGTGLLCLRCVVYGTLFLALLGGYAALRFHGLQSAEAMETAHVARNLAHGHGFTTRCIRPFDLGYLAERTPSATTNATATAAPPGLPDRIPDLYHPPAYPLLLSWMQRLMRPSYTVSQYQQLYDAEYKTVVPLGIILTLLCALALYRVGGSLFNPRVAGLATIIYAVSNLTLAGSISGLPLPLLSLAVTLAVGAALRALHFAAIGRTGRMLLSVCGSAMFAAIAVLTDYTMIAVVAALALLLGLQLERWRWASVLCFVVLSTACVAPWLIHNHDRGIGILGAKPYTAVMESPLYEDDALQRSINPHFNTYRVARAIRHKIVASVASSLSARDAMAGGVIVCFVLLALFHRYDHPGASHLKWWLVGSGGLLILCTPLIGPAYAVLPALFPLAVLLGTSAFIEYIEHEEFFEEGWKTVLTWGLIGLTALPAVALVLTKRPGAYPPYYAPLQRFVCSLIEDDERLLTDIPWATAWYGNCTSVLTPQTPANVNALPGGWSQSGGLYLTTETANRPIDKAAAWRSLWHHEVPDRIPFRHAIHLPAGRPDQLFLTDRPRWAAPPAADTDDEKSDWGASVKNCMKTDEMGIREDLSGG